jgi:mannose-1-phosphate guanylyltransferase
MSSNEVLFSAPAFTDLRSRALAASCRSERTWAIVLAAGDGTRLQALTTDASGIAVPKQFCSLRDGPSLLHDALRRAESVTARSRICVVVAEQHARWWRAPLAALPRANVVVQPRNCGTGTGLLLPLLHVLERDSQARIAVLPSDHHVCEDDVLTTALERSLAALRDPRRGVLLLGMAPDDADPELGYIEPERGSGSVLPIARFVEKPCAAEAESLIERGALWNSFIVAARGAALLKIFARHDPDLVLRMHAAVRRDAQRRIGAGAIARLYRTTPYLDFSRDVLPQSVAALGVARVPPCGWTDLGTPERLGRTLREPAAERTLGGSVFRLRGQLSLEHRHAEAMRQAAG